MTISSGPPNLKQLQKLMFFIDGTNLFIRLRAAKLKVPSLAKLFQLVADRHFGGREVVRMYLYTIESQKQTAVAWHGPEFLSGVRVVLGDGIPSSGGNVKEKGVDALLVADLIYHAAQKNCDFAVVVSIDTDFRFAIQRVEDFGCRTAVVSIASPIPDRLVGACDLAHENSEGCSAEREPRARSPIIPPKTGLRFILRQVRIS